MLERTDSRCQHIALLRLAQGGKGRTLWWLRGVLVRKCDLQLEQAAFPDSLLFAWYTTIPLFEVHHAVCAAHGLSEEAERVVASPLLPVAVLVGAPGLPVQSEHTSPQRDGSCTETWCGRRAGFRLRCVSRSFVVDVVVMVQASERCNGLEG